MAQFGTIEDWLKYDRIKLAQTEQNILGRAVGEIGQGIGDALGDYTPEDKKEEQDTENVDPREFFKNQKFDANPLEVTLNNFDPIIFTPSNVKERPKKVYQPNTMVGGLEWEIGKTATFDPRVVDKPLTENDSLGYEGLNYMTPIVPGSADDPAAQNQFGSGLPQIGLNPLGSGIAYGEKAIKRNLDQAAAYYEEKFNIKSPIKRVGQDGMDDQARSESVQSRGYIYNPATGKTNTAFAEGYNARLVRESRKRQVWDNAEKSLDDAISATTVEPSGFNMLDGTLQILGSQMQQSYLDLQSNKYDMSPEEFAQRKAQSTRMPKLINQTMQVLKQRVSDFEENRSSLSKATPTTTVEILDSLAKNEGTLRPVIEDGIPYLAGKTYAGTDVKVAMSEITNGKNDFKFFKQADINKPLQGLVDKYSKLKTEAEFRSETGSGLVKTTIPIGSFKDSIMSDFDTLLSDENTLRTVVSDYMGADFDTFEEIKASGNNPKEMAKNQLYAMFEKKWAPYSKQRDVTSYQRNEAQSAGRSTASERSSSNIAQELASMKPITQTNYKKYEKQITKDNLAKGYRIRFVKGEPTVVKYNLKTNKPEFTRPYSQKLMLELAGAQAGTKLPILNK